MHYKISLLIFMCLSLFLGCNSGQSTKISEDSQDIRSEVLKTDIDKISYTDYVLSEASLKATADWTKFHELEKETDNLKQAKLDFFKEDAKVLKTFVKDLKETIPETINKEDVTTRITALENAMYYLFSELNLNRQDKDLSLKAIEYLLVSISNLKLQINKKLELENQNIIKPQ